ncbi:hypothetical protein [Salinicoccus roseus]|uniref:hypothetical protein n=1 Tax=Salinicoccus roseus TaxID=45670 RepID=UPI0035623FA9
MTDTHITTDELVIIEAYFHHDTPISHIAKRIGRARQTVHNVIAYLRDGHTALDYYQRHQENKKRCGRKRMVLPTDNHIRCPTLSRILFNMLMLVRRQNNLL